MNAVRRAVGAVHNWLRDNWREGCKFFSRLGVLVTVGVMFSLYMFFLWKLAGHVLSLIERIFA